MGRLRDLSNLPFIFTFLDHFSHIGKYKHRRVNFPKLRESRKSRENTEHWISISLLEEKSLLCTQHWANWYAFPKLFRETPSFLLLFIHYILSVKTGNWMVLNIRWTIAIMLNSLTFLIGITDRECGTAFVLFLCGTRRLVKEYMTPLSTFVTQSAHREEKGHHSSNLEPYLNFLLGMEAALRIPFPGHR